MIQVWLIEDNESFRSTVARAMNGLDGIRCARQFATCEAGLEALAEEKAEKPQVILLDLGLPGMGGLDGLPRLTEAAGDAKVVILTIFEDHDRVFRALCAGAAGYLLKTSPLQEIADAIREVVNGGAPMNPRIARRVLDLFARFPPQNRDYGLTPREREILHLMVDGLIKKTIADRLSLSFHTVDAHLRKIYEKLHVTTRQAAVAKALKEGLT